MARKKKNHSGGGTYAQPGPGGRGPVRRTKPGTGGTYATNEAGRARPRGSADDPYGHGAQRGGRPYSSGVQTPRPQVWRTNKAIPSKDALSIFPPKTIAPPTPAGPNPFDQFASLINSLTPSSPAISLQDYTKPYDQLDSAIEAQALLNARSIIQSDTRLRDALAGINQTQAADSLRGTQAGLQAVDQTTAATQGIYDTANQSLAKFGVPGGVTPNLEQDKAMALQDLAGDRQNVVDDAAESRDLNALEANSRNTEAALTRSDAEAALNASKLQALMQSSQGRAEATANYNAAVNGQQQQDFQNRLAAVNQFSPVFDQYAAQQTQQAQQSIMGEVQDTIHPGSNPNQATYFNSLTSRYDSADQALADLEAAEQSGDLEELGIGPGQKAKIADWIQRWYGAEQATTPGTDPLSMLQNMIGRVRAVR